MGCAFLGAGPRSGALAVAATVVLALACTTPTTGRTETGIGGPTPGTGTPEAESTDVGPADSSGAPGDGSSGTSSGGVPGSTSTAATSSTDDGPVDLGCDTVVFEQLGVVKVVEHGDSSWTILPLPPGASFHCMRVEFDLQTVDSQQEILDMYPGCPIFLLISSLDGQGPEGVPLASMLFKPWRVGCTPGPDRVELDTFADSLVEQGPWPLGGLYHVRIEANLDTTTSTVSLWQEGVQVGPTVSAALTGVTLEMARDPRVGLGMVQPAGDAYFPDYGATYSNLRVTADIAP